jgi:hypothetical protein
MKINDIDMWLIEMLKKCVTQVNVFKSQKRLMG